VEQNLRVDGEVDVDMVGDERRALGRLGRNEESRVSPLWCLSKSGVVRTLTKAQIKPTVVCNHQLPVHTRFNGCEAFHIACTCTDTALLAFPNISQRAAIPFTALAAGLVFKPTAVHAESPVDDSPEAVSSPHHSSQFRVNSISDRFKKIHLRRRRITTRSVHPVHTRAHTRPYTYRPASSTSRPIPPLFTQVCRISRRCDKLPPHQSFQHGALLYLYYRRTSTSQDLV
jgi:hypothetical protein